MKEILRVKKCPNCPDGGYVFVAKDHLNRNFYLTCDECEYDWDNPEEFFSDDGGEFQRYGEPIEATKEEIITIGWDNFVYVLKSSDGIWENLKTKELTKKI